MEGKWLIDLCFSQAELFPFFYIQPPCALFLRQNLRPYLLARFFFVNSTFKVEMGFAETKIEQLGSRCFTHPFLYLYGLDIYNCRIRLGIKSDFRCEVLKYAKPCAEKYPH